MNSIKEQLFHLQTAQLEHDELFHKEITRLNIHQRLNHMALHFAKYSGKICGCVLNSSDEKILRKTIIDSFVISTTCINTLNIRLSDKFFPQDNYPRLSLDDLANNLSMNLNINIEDSLWLVKIYPIAVGELAKACESLDHLEPYAYRELITESIVKISSLMIIAAAQLKIDLIVEVPKRLMEVKKKSIFFDYYMAR